MLVWPSAQKPCAWHDKITIQIKTYVEVSAAWKKRSLLEIVFIFVFIKVGARPRPSSAISHNRQTFLLQYIQIESVP